MISSIASQAMGWLALSFCLFVFFQTAGMNLAPAWAKSRVVLALLILMTIIGSQSMMV